MATGLAGRYATALFGLAREGKQIDTVSASLAKVRAALAESEDFRALTASPLIGRGAATSAVLGAAEAMGLDGITRNFLGVLATNRRLGALADIIREIGRASCRERVCQCGSISVFSVSLQK